MRVFDACIKMMKQHKGVFLTNILVLGLLLFFMVVMGDNSMYGHFNAKKPDYTLVNRDGDGPLAEGLAQVLERYGNYVEIADEKDALMDAGFYGEVDGIFIIPEGFQEAFWNGEDVSLEYWQYPSAGEGYYLESLVQQYFYMVKLNHTLDDTVTQEEVASAAAKSAAKEAEVTVRQYRDGSSVSEKIRLYERFIPYLLLFAEISCVSIIFLNFKRPEIRMRNLCSPKPPTSMALQKLLFTGIVAVIVWVVMNVLGSLACASEWKGLGWQINALFLANSFAVMLVSVSVALLCSCVVRSSSTQPFVANLVSLSMGFLGGAFVPLELLSDGILQVAKFIPIYWYEKNVYEIAGLTGFSAENLRGVWQNIAMQIGFAAALFVIYLLVNKYMEQAAESYGASKTEIEM